MSLSKLLQTEKHLIEMHGEAERHDGYWVLRTPSNPDYYFGNVLILDQAPSRLEPWLQAFEKHFSAEVSHRCLQWSGAPLKEASMYAARNLGFETDGNQEMILDSLPTERTEWLVRALNLTDDWEALVALNIASDASEQLGAATYRRFKEKQRANIRHWIEQGLATWWGAFDGEQLVGQCGFVVCAELGRFQAVETHPDWQRRGVCTNLITHVARDAMSRLGLTDLILLAEVDGPALGLYRRIGFRLGEKSHSLLRAGSTMQVRQELKGDHAGVRSLINAAFGQADEAQLVEALRNIPSAISLVADRANSILGHILFTPLSIEGPGSKYSAVALAPIAVRPLAQGQGIGAALIEAGLEKCKAAGFDLCILIGHPGYYPRFGFQSATALGLSNPFGADGEEFMALALTPGALESCAGKVIYAEAFTNDK